MPSPVTITQDQDQAKLAYSLQRRANIDLVGLTDLTAKCKLNVQDVVFPLKFGLHYQPDKVLVNGQKLVSPVQFSFRVIDDHDTEAISIECVFRADYELSEGYQPTAEEIEAFTNSNAVFNCWPYFRELAQSILTRMNYPPLSIPFLRLAPKQAVINQPVQAELISEQAPQKMIGGTVPKKKRRPQKKEGRV